MFKEGEIERKGQPYPYQVTMKKILMSLLLGAIISTGALYLAFCNVPFEELGAYLLSINYFWVIPSSFIVIFSFFVRVQRWRIILKDFCSISFWQAFHPLFIAFMINCVLPARVGEVARPLILQKTNHIPFATGLATVVAERVMDMTVLILLFGILLITIEIDPNHDILFDNQHLNKTTLKLIAWGILYFLIIILISIALLRLKRSRQFIINAMVLMSGYLFFFNTQLQKKVRKTISLKLITFSDNLAKGLFFIKKPKLIASCFSLSLIIWFLHAFSYYILSLGCIGIELSFPELTAVMIIVCFFILLPSVPGYWGLWEAGGIFALSLFGIANKEAAGYTLVNHAIQILPVIIIGLISALIISINLSKIFSTTGPSKYP